jgi:hypothetical protein
MFLKSLVAIVLGCLLLKANNSLAQNDGLRFKSYEVVQDQRTGISLFPASIPVSTRDICEVSFELSFLKGHPYYFGNILRLLVNDQLNIDLLFDSNPFASGHIRCVIGDSASGISLGIDTTRLLNHWNTIRLVLNGQTGELLVYHDQRLAGKQQLPARERNSLRFFLGAHHYQGFANTDVPPMKLRNIRVLKNDKPVGFFPLNEHKGVIVHDTIAGRDGRVENPDWLNQHHFTWQKAADFTMPGPASVLFDADADKLYVFGRDSAYIYNIGTASVERAAYASGRQPFMPGTQSLYAPLLKKLYNIFPDQHLVSTYDAVQRRWDIPYPLDSQITVWHFSPFLSAVDTSIYVLGGYGHFSYHNTLLRYAINHKKWDTITPVGDRFIPRYLFGGGSNAAGDTAYFIGGYGSSSGKQIEHPHNLYDLMRYTVRDRKFQKIYTLPKPAADVAFASSLVLEEGSQSFYALVYPNHTFDSRLRLLKGSLTSPSYTLLADEIPYPFQDITSFADLYYSPQSNKLLAVTLYLDSSQHTQVRLFDIAAPPGVELYADTDAAHNNAWLWWGAGLVAVAAGMAFYYKRRRRQHGDSTLQAGPVASPLPPTGLPVETVTPLENRAPFKRTRNALFLFGEFQLFDKEGVDVTRSFSPVLKELFLVICLHTIHTGRGVSSDKLIEALWPDKPSASARNNRSVNVTKLKNLLEGVEHLQLVKNDDYLALVADPEHFYVDYAHYRSLVVENRQPGRQHILELSAIVSRGGFLSGLEKEWLDAFKADVSNTIIDHYMQFAGQTAVPHDAALLAQLAGEVFYFDPLHEQALAIKCNALVALGKHALARKTYEQYCREYRKVYAADYEKTLPEILGAKEV